MADPITVGTALAVGQKAAAVTRGLGFLRDHFDEHQQKKTEEWWRRIIEQVQARTTGETQGSIEERLHDLEARTGRARSPAANSSW